MSGVKNNKRASSDENIENELCPKCGSVFAEEDGFKFCPHCDASIDYFGEGDDDDF